MQVNKDNPAYVYMSRALRDTAKIFGQVIKRTESSKWIQVLITNSRGDIVDVSMQVARLIGRRYENRGVKVKGDGTGNPIDVIVGELNEAMGLTGDERRHARQL